MLQILRDECECDGGHEMTKSYLSMGREWINDLNVSDWCDIGIEYSSIVDERIAFEQCYRPNHVTNSFISPIVDLTYDNCRGEGGWWLGGCRVRKLTTFKFDLFWVMNIWIFINYCESMRFRLKRLHIQNHPAKASPSGRRRGDVWMASNRITCKIGILDRWRVHRLENSKFRGRGRCVPVVHANHFRNKRTRTHKHKSSANIYIAQTI